MNGFAALAAKEAVVASGLGTGLLPGIAPSALDGFAVGTLLSGLCVLMVMAPRRGFRRNRRSAHESRTGAGHAAGQPDRAPGVSLIDPFADESAEVVVPMGSPLTDEFGHEPQDSGYRSKHRQADRDAGAPRPEIRRSSGRHAAPSSGMSRKAGRPALDPVAARD